MIDPILRVRDNDGKITEIYSYKGDPGDDGVSITNATINDDNELVLEFSNGSTSNLGVVVGADGYTPIKGKDYFDGVGIDSITQSIESIVDGGANRITVLLTDGSEHTFIIRNGSKGSDGVGIEAVTQSKVSSADGGTNTIKVTLTDGSSSTFDVKNGAKGSTGVGISSVSYVNGIWKFTKTDKSVSSVSLPTIANPNNYYTKSETDAMFNEYISEIASIVMDCYSVSFSWNGLQGDSITMSNASIVTPSGESYINEVDVSDSDYSYQILMGGEDITNEVSTANGRIISVNIIEVTGDIEINITYSTPMI